jgi:hypothetical protein
LHWNGVEILDWYQGTKPISPRPQEKAR